MSEPNLDRTILVRAVSAFRGARILVLGDVMLDRYWWGTVNRISPEAPVPVLRKQRSTTNPGGAANVAANVSSLGGTPFLVGVIGSDEPGREMAASLEARGIDATHLIRTSTRPTTVKTRIVAHNQHVVRIDDEDSRPIEEDLVSQVLERIDSLISLVDLIVISDYAKGLLTRELLGVIIQKAGRVGCRVIVDPKGTDFSRYNGAYLLTPNRKEALAATNLSPDQNDGVIHAGLELLEVVAVESILITQGEDGMTLFERKREPMHLPAQARAVYDVTGAGDTAIATIGLALATHALLPAAAQLANIAAGLAVERVGTATVQAGELFRSLGPRGQDSGILPNLETAH